MVRRPVSASASAPCGGTGCRRAGPSTKSGARAGGRRLSDRRLHRWLAGTSASAPSSHGAADLLGLNRAHICVRNQFFLEQRECVRLLAQQTNDQALSHRYLNGQYYWFLGQGANLSVADAWTTFSDAPISMRWQAMWTTLRFNINRMLGRGINHVESDTMGPQ